MKQNEETNEEKRKLRKLRHDRSLVVLNSSWLSLPQVREANLVNGTVRTLLTTRF